MTDDDNTFVRPAPGAWGVLPSLFTYEVATLRDQFAMAALTGLMAINPAKDSLKGIAEFSYVAADAMMEARK